MAPRWRKPLTRNRGSVGCENAMSRSPVSSNASRRRGEIAVTASSTSSRSPSLERRSVRQRLEVAVHGGSPAAGRASGGRRSRPRSTAALRRGHQIHAYLNIGTRVRFSPSALVRVCQRASRATSAQRRAREPRASSGWRTSPARSPATTPNTPGERAAQKQTAGCRSIALLRRPRRCRVVVERRREPRAYASRVAGEDRLRGEPRGHERLVHPVA